jgi:tellurite resistance protein TerC
VLSHLIHRFIYLKIGLALVLSFVGAKMIAKRFIDIPNWASLAIIVVVLATTIFFSMRATRRRAKRRGVRAPRQASTA